ncbi:hypothetical protein KC332_g18196 [Hortaea werneckii]|nr:hypothetical protein KC358_g18335 [Hortaea werneckii]KAI6823803.1 hypothetical protein KC350_g9153 [Hortaea werneckii]KAI6895485.1 hypothetical protein KC348_g18239 [Hortaea werneckii]KAI6917860.1 hypothetical protein KC341_g18290 [Hortaea werneckii]KAI6950925.1 hypothetical protein KC321_g18256 [Hortaea werneckii]
MAPQQSKSNDSMYCYTCTQYGHEFSTCSNSCVHCQRSHATLPCPYALSVYPVTQEDKQNQERQATANLQARLLEKTETVAQLQAEAAQLRLMLDLVEQGVQFPPAPEGPPPSADAEAEASAAAKGSQPEGKPARDRVPVALRLFGPEVKTWADAGLPDSLTGNLRSRKIRHFNAQVEGLKPWHKDDELSTLLKAKSVWPPPGHVEDAEGKIVRDSTEPSPETPSEAEKPNIEDAEKPDSVEAEMEE